MSGGVRLQEWEITRIKRMWADGVTAKDIAMILERNRATINLAAKKLGLPKRKWVMQEPKKKTVREIRREHARKVGDLLHRASLGFKNPIRVTYQPKSVFGLPMREIEPKTRALIEEALYRRDSP